MITGISITISFFAALFVLIASAISSYNKSKEDVKNIMSENYGKKARVEWFYPILFSVSTLLGVLLIAVVTN